jgi:hypothetical protein
MTPSVMHKTATPTSHPIGLGADWSDGLGAA